MKIPELNDGDTVFSLDNNSFSGNHKANSIFKRVLFLAFLTYFITFVSAIVNLIYNVLEAERASSEDE